MVFLRLYNEHIAFNKKSGSGPLHGTALLRRGGKVGERKPEYEVPGMRGHRPEALEMR